jgi:hypothetical protein
MSANTKSNFRIETPHAAIKIWNYVDRGGAEGMSAVNSVSETIISTVSCVSITTNKTKSSPIGTFSVVLAPSRNWVSHIVAGSWCVIMMSNEKITQDVLDRANRKHVKMFGKIESVRASVEVDDTGARRTYYIVEGVDWGYIFDNKIYMDPYIASTNEPQTWGNTFAAFLVSLVDAKNGAPYQIETNDLLMFFIKIFASNSATIQTEEGKIGRLGKAVYRFLIPDEVSRFFGFAIPNNTSSSGNNESEIEKEQKIGADTRDIANLIHLISGKLVGYDSYQGTYESYTFLNPYTLQGVNTLWQVMMDAINRCISELVTDMEWTPSGRPKLSLYNRIYPFSYRSGLTTDAQGQPIGSGVFALRSMFYNLKRYNVDNVTVLSVNIGTNWADKYNFVEVRPDFPEFRSIDGLIAQKSQAWDPVAFSREGFRPLIKETRHFPRVSQDDPAFAPEKVKHWVQLNMEWHFDTHRLLSGAIRMTGTSDYISVGSNIRFEYGLVNPQNNYSAQTNKNKSKIYYVLAHVESVQHTFTVEEDGARSFVTSVQFVRGIVVDGNNIPADRAPSTTITRMSQPHPSLWIQTTSQILYTEL